MFDINKLNRHDNLWYSIEDSKSCFKQELYKEIRTFAPKFQ